MTTRTPPTKASPPRSPPKGPTTPPAATPIPPATDRAAGTGDIVLAVVIGAHAVGGEVRLKVFAQDLKPHGSFNRGTLTVLSLRGGSNGTIVRFAEVTTREAAEALRGTELSVPRDALPPLGDEEYYHADLIGLPATSTAGDRLGVVVAVENFGAGDVIEIERPAVDGHAGKRFMVPMRAEAVPEWSADGLTIDEAWVA